MAPPDEVLERYINRSHFFFMMHTSFPISTKNQHTETLDMKTIIILGGSFAGVSIAHRILKQSTKSGSSVKVVLVSPNTHVYWSVAAPRALIPGQFASEKLFKSITEGFKQYSSNQFEFVLGFAQSLDPAARKVGVSTGSEEQKTLDYDFLIIATGSRNKEGNVGATIPFKGLDSTEATKTALESIQGAVERSKTIVISGAGPTGVETAGELAFEYGTKKKIILVRPSHFFIVSKHTALTHI
jgi:apoptosis-inducing factor 2